MTPLREASIGKAPRLSLELVVMNVAFIVLGLRDRMGRSARYVTKSPATWVEEVSSIAFTCVVFVGAAEVHRRGKHVSVDLVTALLPTQIRGLLDVAVRTLSRFTAFTSPGLACSRPSQAIRPRPACSTFR